MTKKNSTKTKIKRMVVFGIHILDDCEAC